MNLLSLREIIIFMKYYSLPPELPTSVSSHSIGKSLGSIGGKLQDWKPTGVKIFSGDKGKS